MILFDLFGFIAENCAVFVLVIFFLCLYFKRGRFYDIISVEEAFTTCNNKDCVRCIKYKVTLETALKKLSQIPNRALAADIKQSIIQTNKNAYLTQKPSVFYYQCLISTPVWDKSIFKDTSLLEETHAVICEEFANLRRKQAGGWTTNATPTGSWDVFYLINQGCVIEENTRACPETMAVINRLPLGMRNNVFGNVMFSVVKPQTFITEHYGPTNIRLRCHLGLEITPDCVLTVAEETVTWEAGKCLVFDDSYLHCVEHTGVALGRAEGERSGLLLRGPRQSSTKDRAVLIVDLWHPDLVDDERNIIDTIFSPG